MSVIFSNNEIPKTKPLRFRFFDQKPPEKMTLREKRLHLEKVVQSLKDELNRDPFADENAKFQRRVEINDIKYRFALTKLSNQQKIKEETGADVLTRGKYYPDKSLIEDGIAPLYLQINSPTQKGLNEALKRVQKLIEEASLMGSLSERIFEQKYHQTKVEIGIEQCKAFNVKSKLVGPSGAYVKHIMQETSTKLQLKGRGSGFIDPGTQSELDEPLFFAIVGPTPSSIEKAKNLCNDLIKTIQIEYNKFKLLPPQAQTLPAVTSTFYPPLPTPGSMYPSPGVGFNPLPPVMPNYYNHQTNPATTYAAGQNFPFPPPPQNGFQPPPPPVGGQSGYPHYQSSYPGY
ncbi:hypothetical protein HK099_004681 [Clydaea vesicula]|uniref:K Homology domain-containing protein n=1 Tax=Clydaea vesicula TaxID=447962 RepID=A0AAD5XY32_9FUNG|nr:hypothetical protein HK099_004681 [Clydaea vesicula]KAJ3390325.1 hypothetical protein HDU92_000564 [Lobulomyces angularis]